MRSAVTQFGHSPATKKQPIGAGNTVGGGGGVKQRDDGSVLITSFLKPVDQKQTLSYSNFLSTRWNRIWQIRTQAF